MLEKLKQNARKLKVETYALYLAARDPRVPWYAKAVVAFVVAHTFSPIDLIPDFIPILGYLDDLIITPLGILLALKLIPKEVMLDARLRAQEAEEAGKIQSRAGAIIVISIWVSGAAVLAFVLYRWLVR